MSRPADRLHYENAKVKQNVRAQLLDIVRKLETPGVEIRDVTGRIDKGVVTLPHLGEDDGNQFVHHGYSGETEYTLKICLYDPVKDARNHLTDLTGD